MQFESEGWGMAEEAGGESSSQIDRRELIRRAALTSGAAVAGAVVIDSFVSPAGAIGSMMYSLTAYNSTAATVTIPSGRAVDYVIKGASGGGGADTEGTYSYAGGAGGAGPGSVPAGGLRSGG